MGYYFQLSLRRLEQLWNKDTSFWTHLWTKQESFCINHPNKFGIYSNKGFIENRIDTPNAIAEELKKLECFTRDFFTENSNLVYSKNASMKNLVSIEMQFPGGNVLK